MTKQGRPRKDSYKRNNIGISIAVSQEIYDLLEKKAYDQGLETPNQLVKKLAKEYIES